MTNPSKLERLVKFASCYDIAHLKVYRRSAGLPDNSSRIISSPYESIKLFTTYAHERQNAGSDYPFKHRLAMELEVPPTSTFEAELLSNPTFPERVWKRFRNLANLSDGSKGASYTIGPVRKILEELNRSRTANWLQVLQGMSPEEAFEWLDDLDGIGPKISSFIVRDMFSIFHLWPILPEGQMYCAQPVDRWVRDWGERLLTIRFKDNPSETEMKKEMKAVAEECNEEGVDPIGFNKAAWFVGSHFQDICDFFDVPLLERLDRTSCLRHFDPDVLTRAIAEYADSLAKKRAFGV